MRRRYASSTLKSVGITAALAALFIAATPRDSEAVDPIAYGTKPVGFFFTTPQQPRVGSSVDFFLITSDPDGGNIVRFQWDLNNDGVFELDRGPRSTLQHVFSSGDVTADTGGATSRATVRLKITDDEGETGVITRELIFGNSNKAPESSFEIQYEPRVNGPAKLNAWQSQDPDGSIVKYEWSFDSGTTWIARTRPVLTHTFSTPGTKSIKLRVTDDHGSTDVSTESVDVHSANQLPTLPRFWLSADSPRVGTSVRGYSWGATDPDGEIVRYEWDFDANLNDDESDDSYDITIPATTNLWGQPGEARFTYRSPGTFKIRLRATDDAGATVTATKTVRVGSINRPPQANAIYLPNVSQTQTPIVRAGRSTTLLANASDPDGQVVKYEWDFDGDGTYDQTATAQENVRFGFYGGQVDHKYLAAGEYNVRLRVTDDSGASDVLDQSIEVRAQNTKPRPTIFPASGGSGSGTTVRTGTPLRFSLDPGDPDGRVTGITWKLDGSSLPGDPFGGWQLSLPAGVPAGQHQVEVEVTDDDGETGKAVFAFSATSTNVAPRIGSINVSSAGGGPPGGSNAVAPGSPVQFSASAEDPDGTPPLCQWDFTNDGTFDTESGSCNGMPAASHSFPSAGDYDVRVRATDADGASAEAVKRVQVRSPGALVATFYGPSRAQSGRTVSFSTPSGYPPGTSFKFEFDNDGDGTYDQEVASQWASHTFVIPGGGPSSVTAKVRLTVSSSGVSDSTTKDVIVSTTNLAPTADFYIPSQGGSVRAGKAISLNAWSSQDPDGEQSALTFAWDFGDGNQASGVSPTHTFSTTGTRTVTLSVTDADGATSTKTQTITVTDGNLPPWASIQVSGQYSWNGTATTREGRNVSLQASSWDPDGRVVRLEADLDGDGAFEVDRTDPSTFYAPFPSRTYSAGSVSIRIRVTDDDGAKTTRSVRLRVLTAGENRAPSVNFESYSFLGNRVKAGGATYFFVTGQDPDGGIVSYEWTFGDGTAQTISGSPPSSSIVHAYASAGSYKMRLVATDDEGATDTVERTIVVDSSNSKPRVQLWQPVPSTPRIGRPVKNNGWAYDQDGYVKKYEWDLDGDGQYDDHTVNFNPAGGGGSSFAPPERTFSAAGRYRIGVKVTDNDDAVAEAHRVINVQAANTPPRAEFGNYPTQLAPQVGKPVTYYANANGDPDGEIVSYRWSFDGGATFQTTTNSAITHTFTQPGEVEGILEVEDNDGAKTRMITQTRAHSGNMRPRAAVETWPVSPRTGQRVQVGSFSSNDIDGKVVKYEWDVDGQPGFETETLPQWGGIGPARTFESAGSYRVGVRVTDDDGATAETYKTVTVADSNVAPVADFSFAPDPPAPNQSVTFVSEASDPDGGAVADIAWDLDNDGEFDDGGDPQASRTFTEPGRYTVSMKATDNDGGSTVKSRVVDVQALIGSGTIGRPGAQPVVAPDGKTVPVKPDGDGATGRTYFSVPAAETNKFDNGCIPLTIQVPISAGSGELSDVKLQVRPNSGAPQMLIPMSAPAEQGSEVWTAEIDCLLSSEVWVRYTLTEEGSPPETFNYEVGGITLIDPQGVVYDETKFAQAKAADPTLSDQEARAVAAIDQATVRLQRKVDGTFRNVLSGDPGIKPNVNPQVTGTDGRYQWDVSAGTYRVIVTMPGYKTTYSRHVDIPPPALDLHVPMTKGSGIADLQPGGGGSPGGGGGSGGGGSGGGSAPGSGGTSGGGSSGGGSSSAPVSGPTTSPPPGSVFSASVSGASSQKLKTISSKGIAVSLRCSAACSVPLEASVDGRTAVKLKLAKKPNARILVGRTTASLSAAGTRSVVLRLNKRALSAFKRVRSVSVRIEGTAAGGSVTPLTVALRR